MLEVVGLVTVGLLIKSEYKLEIVTSRGLESQLGTFESLCIKIRQDKDYNITIGSINRPPGSSVVDFNRPTDLNYTPSRLSTSSNRLYLAEDFNINLLVLRTT